MKQLEAAKEVMQVFIDHGYDVYIVGGFVRDYVMGREGGDIDLASNATPEEVLSLFPQTVLTGVKHGTVSILWGPYVFEVTTFRKEGTYRDYRWPDHVEYVDSFEEDVKRRDFTMNALGLAIDGTLVDYVGGVADIQKRIIRTVGNPYERMKEDALRMLRAFRFVSTLDFTIHPDTLQAIRTLGHLMENISQERIIEELKQMLEGQAFLKALKLMKETSFIKQLGFFEAGLALCLDKSYQPATFAEFLAVCTLFGDSKGLKQLPLAKKLVQYVRRVVAFYRDCGKVHPWSLFTYGRDVVITGNRIQHFIDGNPLLTDDINRLWSTLPIKCLKDLAVDGHDLMSWFDRKGGPWLNELLHRIAKAVITGEVKNETDQIRHFLLKNK